MSLVEDEETISERRWVEQYMEYHNLEASLTDALNKIVVTQPLDPFVVMADLLKANSKKQSGILSVLAREIFSSNGVPTIEVEVTTHKGMFSASYPCKELGMGPKDLVEERDGVTLGPKEPNARRFYGKGLTEIVKTINDILSQEIMQFDPLDQKGIDAFLKKRAPKPIPAPLLPDEEKAEKQAKERGGKDYAEKIIKKKEKDDADRKAAIPHCALLPISMAVCKAGAAHSDMPVWEYIAKLAGRAPEETCIPVPMFVVIDGGVHGHTKNMVQELMIMPDGAESFAEAMRIGVEVSMQLRKRFKREMPEALQTGELGGFCPNKSPEDVLQILSDAIEQTEHKEKIKICIDMAASHMKVPVEEGELERGAV
jgi:enolase